jgi:hypothetical protein
MAGDEVVIKRGPGLPVATVVMGAMIVAIGAIILPSPKVALAASVFLLVGGGLPLLWGIVTLVKGQVRLRATEAGVWFGGGAVVPWVDIDSVFVATADLRRGGKAASISFMFKRWQTIFRLSPTLWIASLVSLAHVDVGFDGREKPSVLVARLQALQHHGSSEG